jgi:hypothetical protein
MSPLQSHRQLCSVALCTQKSLINIRHTSAGEALVWKVSEVRELSQGSGVAEEISACCSWWLSRVRSNHCKSPGSAFWRTRSHASTAVFYVSEEAKEKV